MFVQPEVWLSVAERDNNGSPSRLRASAAHNEWNHVGITLVGMVQGFFAEEGISEIELISFPEESRTLLDREALQIDLLARGSIDVAIDPRTTFVLKARSDGKPVSIVAARRRNHAFILVGQKGVRSVQDLRGATVHLNEPGGATDVMLRLVLQDSGIEPERDVDFHYTGDAMHDTRGITKLFTEGQYGPALLVTNVELQRLIRAGFPVLADLRTMYPSRHDRVTAANDDFVQGSPGLLKAFLKGMIRSCRWALDERNHQHFKEIILDAGFLTTEREQRSYEGLFEEWLARLSRDLALPEEGIERIAAEEKRSGRLPDPFDVADVLRLQTLAAAQTELPDVAATADR